ncbi:MAG: secreted protein [Frankiales bacterium]|nr:secreted protein [Frankiales bacterium]
MSETSTPTASTPPGPRGTAPTGKKKRGRENVRDMLLSMAVCVAIVVPIWFLGQPDPSDSKAIRRVDPTADIAAFRQAAPGVPVPTTPPGWTATSSTLDGPSLRIGYVTDSDGYVEYAASTGDAATFVRDQTGRARSGSSLTVGTRRFVVHSGGGDHTSLVLQEQGGATVVLGGLRETAGDEELSELAATLR